MNQWHHHHDHDDRLVFCRGDYAESDCYEEYDGLVCQDSDCPFHLAIGKYVVDVPEQMALVTLLEAVPDVED